ncbi:hypothetical protein [Pseudogracilibacillus auburnensis]|uniref:hypothetical protein n=1 Tax=Pseudogracilibacillus auburnensis TaxID=1494959 RepID=UPI001DC8D460|nr:hypothetical protein [Pseudogracilibacillus auburnensis]MBO1005775.1 hypothetical protein [Pseudogracilibacillus auburnensis]
MQRDPETGRFLPGNKIAKGNKGNCSPKWGNKNALKHGFFAKHQLARITQEGELDVFTGKGVAYRIAPDYYFVDEQGRVRLHDKVANMLEKMGVKLEIVEEIPTDAYKIEYRNGRKFRKCTIISGAYHY